MQLFDEIILELTTQIDSKKKAGLVSTLEYIPELDWPEGGTGNIILQSDTGLELGNPKDESVSFIAWTGKKLSVEANSIKLIGPDVFEARETRLPFGKIVLLNANGFNEENCYDRYKEIELLRYNVSVLGYMIRGVPQHMREWSRISKEAIKQGLSFSILGSALINKFLELEYVESVEVIFVTASGREVLDLRKYGERVTQYIGAMSKMTEELDFECASCDYQEVCGEVDDLRSMRESIKKEKGTDG